MDTATLIGTTGATLILIAFILNQRHIWNDTEARYDFMNVVGSLLLFVYAIMLQSYPFMILNLVWLLVSLNDILKRS